MWMQWSPRFLAHVRYASAARFIGSSLAVTMQWDYVWYCQVCERRALGGGLSRKEKRICEEFASWAQSMKSVSKPRTVVDCYSRIIAWILPSVLPQRTQVRILDLHRSILAYSVEELQDNLTSAVQLLDAALKSELAKGQAKRSVPWRYRADLFKDSSHGGLRGLLNLSPAWFMAGWEV